MNVPSVRSSSWGTPTPRPSHGRSRMGASNIARALRGRKVGASWMACCPAHEDREPSLSIGRSNNGKLLVHCHAGCNQHDVIALDATRGTDRWRQNTNEPGATTEGSAVVVAGPVVVAGDYNLVAFDRITGAFRWRFVPAVGFAPGIYLGDVSRGLVFAGSPAGRVSTKEAADA